MARNPFLTVLIGYTFIPDVSTQEKKKT